jgi:Flp pilus assembly protein TadG
MNAICSLSRRRASVLLKRVLLESDGSELVEFALSASVLFLVIFGIMDGSRLVYAHHFVAEAAAAGVRYSTTHGNSWTAACPDASTPDCVASSANVVDYVKKTATVGVSTANITVVPNWTGTTPDGTSCSDAAPNDPGCMITINVSYAFSFTLPFIPHSSMTLKSSASGIVQM